MARPRASDHDAKRLAMLGKAAELFAERGYARASMSEIAEACGSSKALLYHYYENKEQLLFDILHAHFMRIEQIVAEADIPTTSPEQRLKALVHGLLVAYEGADATHRVQINDLGSLPPQRQAPLKNFQRKLARRFSSALADLNPELARNPDMLMPATMSLFGMLNWSYLWFKPDGPMTRSQYAELVTRIMTRGIADPKQLEQSPVMRSGARRPTVRRNRREA